MITGPAVTAFVQKVSLLFHTSYDTAAPPLVASYKKPLVLRTHFNSLDRHEIKYHFMLNNTKKQKYLLEAYCEDRLTQFGAYVSSNPLATAPAMQCFMTMHFVDVDEKSNLCNCKLYDLMWFKNWIYLFNFTNIVKIF